MGTGTGPHRYVHAPLRRRLLPALAPSSPRSPDRTPTADRDPDPRDPQNLTLYTGTPCHAAATSRVSGSATSVVVPSVILCIVHAQTEDTTACMHASRALWSVITLVAAGGVAVTPR